MTPTEDLYSLIQRVGGGERRLSKRAWIACLAVVVSLVAAVGAWALQSSPTAILGEPDRFDGQIVTISGTVTNVQPQVSQRGNAYFTFELSDGRKSITVFKFGESPCRTGATATVEGRFQKVKQAGDYTFRNQVDATKIAC
jgi:cytochrome c-type biogenesis protein CcmE